MIKIGMVDDEHAFIFHLKDQKILRTSYEVTKEKGLPSSSLIKIQGAGERFYSTSDYDYLSSEDSTRKFSDFLENGIFFEPTSAHLECAKKYASEKQKTMVWSHLSRMLSNHKINKSASYFPKYSVEMNSLWSSEHMLLQRDILASFENPFASSWINRGFTNSPVSIPNMSRVNERVQALSDVLASLSFKSVPRPFPERWCALLEIQRDGQKEYVLTRQVHKNAKTEWPVQAATLDEGPESHLMGLRIYDRPEQSFAGNVFETASFLLFGNIQEVVPLKGSVVRHICFFERTFSKFIPVVDDIVNTDLKRLFLPDFETLANHPESALWSEDHGHHAVMATLRRLQSVYEAVLAYKMSGQKTRDEFEPILRMMGVSVLT